MNPITRREFSGLLALVAPAAKLSGAAVNIDDVLREGAMRRKIPAVVAIAGSKDRVTYTGAFGNRDAASGVPVSANSIFAIASMTKAITSAAAMQLVERGKVKLDEPVSKFLPELGKLQVLDGFDSAGKPILRPARTPVTLRHLLTHTSGFAYDTWHEGMFKLAQLNFDATHVLAFEPGTKWQYGMSTFWAGRLVEAVSGNDLEAYMQANLLKPLGMADTSFLVPPSKFDRYVSKYQRERNGTLTEQPRAQPERPPVLRGDGGLYSTAADYIKFTQMILRKGAGPKGERILESNTVAMMSVNGTGNIAAGRLPSFRLERSSPVDFHSGHDDRYTLGFLTNPDAYPGARSAGSLAWAGINNTYYWIDPTRGISGVILMHFLPFADKEAVALLDEFERAVYANA